VTIGQPGVVVIGILGPSRALRTSISLFNMWSLEGL
jgi:hypothetical protein